MEREKLSFEEAFAQLEKVISALEEGSLPLEEAIALFERGTKLANQCSTKLDEAELKVKKLLPLLEGGYEARDVDRQPGGNFLL